MDPEKKKKELEDIEEQLKQLDEEEQNKLDEMRADEEVKKEYNNIIISFEVLF